MLGALLLAPLLLVLLGALSLAHVLLPLPLQEGVPLEGRCTQEMA